MMSAPGPRLTTWALQQDGSYLGYTGCQTNVVVTAAHDPQGTSANPPIADQEPGGRYAKVIGIQ
jgi:hypothetical protein